MDWKPKRWIATLLGLFVSPLGFLYLLRPWHAVIYFLGFLAIAFLDFARPVVIYHTLPSWFAFAFLLMIVSAFNCYELAGSSETIATRRWYSRWWGLISILAAYYLIALCLRAFVIEPFRIPSASMFPTLHENQYFVVKKFGYGYYGSYGIMLLHRSPSVPISRGDILVFRVPNDPATSYVKRVVGLPGDRFSFRNRRIVINGNSVATKCTAIADGQRCTEQLDDAMFDVIYGLDRRDTDFELVIPDGSYFMLGDNRNNSRDSRFIGPIPAQNIVGKVWLD